MLVQACCAEYAMENARKSVDSLKLKNPHFLMAFSNLKYISFCKYAMRLI